MALVTCPECGRENVSDSASACPNCGYNVKDHYDKIKHKEQEINKQEKIENMSNTHKQSLNYCPECKKEFPGDLRVCPNCGLSLDDKENVLRLKEIMRLESIANDKFWFKDSLKLIITFSVFSICFFILFYFIRFGLFSAGGVLSFLLTIVFLFTLYSDYASKEKAKEELELAKKDYDKYKAQKDKQREAAKRQSAIDNAKKAANHPKCPNCDSTNTVRITTANRMASVAAVGIASSKIGKQYQCLNCKYKW